MILAPLNVKQWQQQSQVLMPLAVLPLTQMWSINQILETPQRRQMNKKDDLAMLSEFFPIVFIS